MNVFIHSYTFFLPEEADNLFKLLNDDNKFSYYHLYHYNQKEKKLQKLGITENLIGLEIILKLYKLQVK